MNPTTVTLLIGGVETEVHFPHGFEKAEGTGLDGKTKVECVAIGRSPQFPGQVFVQDDDGNTIRTNENELYVASAKAAPGYVFTAVKHFRRPAPSQ